MKKLPNFVELPPTPDKVVQFRYRDKPFHLSFFHHPYRYEFEFRRYPGGKEICTSYGWPEPVSEEMATARLKFNHQLRHFYADASYGEDHGDDWLQSPAFARAVYRLLDVYVDGEEAKDAARVKARGGKSVIEHIRERANQQLQEAEDD